MKGKVILNTDDIQVVACNDNYKVNTYSYEGKHNGEIIIAKEDIERIYYAMKLNEINKN